VETVMNDLEPETTYEVQVASRINSYGSRPSEIITFTTPGRPEFSCGEAPGAISPVEVKPLPSARAGNIFKVGEFEMTVVKIEGSDGNFSGLGSMLVPYLNARVNCTFTDIRVNINHEVTHGEVTAITGGMGGLIDRWKENDEEQGEDEGEDVPAEDETVPPPFEGEDIMVTGIIENITTDIAGSTVTIIKMDGSTEEYALAAPKGDEAGEQRFSDEQGNVWVVDREGEVRKVDGGNSPGAGGIYPEENVLMVQKELIKEVLEYHKQEIKIWLDNHEKGPLEDGVIKRMMDLPGCFPKDEGKLLLVLEKVDYYLEHREELIELIEQDDEVKDRFRFLVNKLNGEQPPYMAGLTELEWDELITMACPYLTVGLDKEDEVLIEGSSRNPEFVVINEIDTELILNKERLNIRFTIEDTLNLSYRKLEIFRVDENDTTLIIFYKNIPSGKDIKFQDTDRQEGWRGYGANGNLVEEGFYLLKLTACINENFIDGFIDYEVFKAKEGLTAEQLLVIQEKSDEGIDTGETWNPSGYACNNAVRAYLYYLKSDTVLFPETMPDKEVNFRYGSGLSGPNDNTVLKGKISWDGTADKMWDDFEDNGNTLTESFTEISKSSTESWNTYFERLQKEANKGVVIVGVVHSDNRSASRGHVVALIPKSLCSGDQTKANNVGNDEEDNVIRPCALEAGGDDKEITWFKQNSNELDDYKWFKYDK
jgi:hypothetical protein